MCNIRKGGPVDQVGGVQMEDRLLEVSAACLGSDKKLMEVTALYC